MLAWVSTRRHQVALGHDLVASFTRMPREMMAASEFTSCHSKALITIQISAFVELISFKLTCHCCEYLFLFFNLSISSTVSPYICFPLYRHQVLSGTYFLENSGIFSMCLMCLSLSLVLRYRVRCVWRHTEWDCDAGAVTASQPQQTSQQNHLHQDPTGRTRRSTADVSLAWAMWQDNRSLWYWLEATMVLTVFPAIITPPHPSPQWF